MSRRALKPFAKYTYLKADHRYTPFTGPNKLQGIDLYRFISARAACQARRRKLANARRLKVMPYIDLQKLSRGTIPRLAKELNVHRKTIYEDIKILKAQLKEKNMTKEDLLKALQALSSSSINQTPEEKIDENTPITPDDKINP